MFRQVRIRITTPVDVSIEVFCCAYRAPVKRGVMHANGLF